MTPSSDDAQAHPDPAPRFTIAQSWWIAAELARRNKFLVYEMHPCAGLDYDVLAVANVVDGSLNPRRLDMNRNGRLHLQPNKTGWMSWAQVLSENNPHTVVRQIEKELSLNPAPKPTTRQRELTYRVIARFLTMVINDRHTWDARMGLDDGDGYSPAPQHDLEAQFLPALKYARELPQELQADPAHHLWILRCSPGDTSSLFHDPDKPVAVMSDDAHLFLPNKKAPVDLMALYNKNQRRLTPTVATALKSVMP